MRHVIAIIVAYLLPVMAFVAVAAEQAASVEGNWSGGGTVVLKSGQKEPVRCRINYEKSTGRTFVISANCAHANGTFQQSGRIVKVSENSYSGRLYSDQYSVSGDISIAVNGNSQTLTATSEKGQATLVLKK